MRNIWLEHFPKNGNRFSAKKCDKQRNLERRSNLTRMKNALVSLAIVMVAACGSTGPYAGIGREARNFRTPNPQPTANFPNFPLFPSWTDEDDSYRFYPGDEIEIQVLGASELSRTMTIAPDGRISPQLIGPIMVADRTPEELRELLENGYRSQLRNPSVNIIPKAFASQKIFIGGEVAKPGIYDLNGELDPMQAIIIAGGFLNSAKREDVVVLRRGVGGQPFMRTYDMKTVFARENAFAELPRLRRFDIIWVPRSRISEVGLFTQQFIREALPVTIGFNYSINSGRSF